MARVRIPTHFLNGDIRRYQKYSGVSGNLSSVGSDTLSNLMPLWTEEFKRLYPNVNIQVQAAGSSTAPPALTEGTSNFGPMSRKIKGKGIEAFEKRFGYEPTVILGFLAGLWMPLPASMLRWLYRWPKQTT